MFDFKDRVAFVTGGGTGIGLACAREVVSGGGCAVLAGRREDVLRTAVGGLGAAASYVVCDVADDASVAAAVEEAVSRHGTLSAGALTHRWMTAYCVSKAGVNMLTQCAADDLGEYGIRVNAVMPGIVDTELAGPLVGSEDAVAEYKRLMPISRVGTPEDVGRLVGFLLSEQSSWMTGQVIGVDGGHTIRKGPDLRSLFRGLLPDEPED